MAFLNKTELVNYTLSLVNRETDQDLIKSMDSFISIVESRFIPQLRLPPNEYTVSTKTDSYGRIGLPNNYIECKFPSCKNSLGEDVVLQRYSEEQGIPLLNVEGEDPQGFFRFGYNLQLTPIKAEVPCTLYFWGVISSLLDYPDNFVLGMYPQIYVYGLMSEITGFLKDMDKAAYWDSKFIKSISDLQSVEDTARYSGSTPFVTRVY